MEKFENIFLIFPIFLFIVVPIVMTILKKIQKKQKSENPERMEEIYKELSGTLYPKDVPKEAASESPPPAETLDVQADNVSLIRRPQESDAVIGAGEKINRLPPLKRAILWAEILGKPTALKERDRDLQSC